MTEFKDKQSFLTWAHEDLKEWHGLSKKRFEELENALRDVLEYTQQILRSVHTAFRIVEDSFLELKTFWNNSFSFPNSHKSFREWIFQACWKKIIAECLLDAKEQLIIHTRKRLKYPSLAEDVVQDAFQKLSQSGPSAVKQDILSWLYRTCQNRAYDLNKKECRKIELDEETSLDTFRSPHPAPDQLAVIKDDYSDLMEYLRKHLNKTQINLLRLKYEQGCSTKEIAQKLSLSENYVRKLLCVTLFMIKKDLGDR